MCVCVDIYIYIYIHTCYSKRKPSIPENSKVDLMRLRVKAGSADHGHSQCSRFVLVNAEL